MIELSEADYELVMRGLRDGLPTLDRKAAITAMRIRMMQAITRQLQSINSGEPHENSRL